MTTAHDVAREIREQLPRAGRVKVQKLLYFCQGWHLAFTGERMFPEAFEAWDLGPVVPSVYRSDKYGVASPPPGEIDDAALRTIYWVTERYGPLAASDLVDISHHEGAPWREARAKRGPSGIIHESDMAAWFGQWVNKSFEPDDELPQLSDRDEMPELLRLLGELAT